MQPIVVVNVLMRYSLFLRPLLCIIIFALPFSIKAQNGFGDLSYDGYKLVFSEDFNYDPATFKEDPAFRQNWRLHPNEDCTNKGACVGWGYEIYRSSMVDMPEPGIMRLKDSAIPSAPCSGNMVGHPVKHISGMLNLTRADSQGVISMGIIEASIKIPPYQGDKATSAWPAFWVAWGHNGDCKGPNASGGGQTEIDIIDNSDGADRSVQNNIFFKTGWKGAEGENTQNTKVPTILSADFHTYSCLWEPYSATFYLDGIFLKRIEFTEETTFSDFQSLYITLQTNERTTNGLEMKVDWVRYWVPEKSLGAYLSHSYISPVFAK